MFTKHGGTKDGHRGDCKQCFYACKRGVKTHTQEDPLEHLDSELQSTLKSLIKYGSSTTALSEYSLQQCINNLQQYFIKRRKTVQVNSFKINMYKLQIAEKNYAYVKSYIKSKFSAYTSGQGDITIRKTKNFESTGMLLINVSPSITSQNVYKLERILYQQEIKYHTCKISLESLDLKKIFHISALVQNHLFDIFSVACTVEPVLKSQNVKYIWNPVYAICSSDKKALKRNILEYVVTMS
jgi:hypothetical protein